jgi:subtilase family serine protease
MRTAPRLLAGLLPLALAAVTLGGIRAPAAAHSIEPAHPRLYFTAADLPALRARTATTHAVQWQALLDWPQPDALAHAAYSGRDVARTHEYIERNAFMYLMLAEADPLAADAHAAIARSWLLELATHDFASLPNTAFEFLWALAIGYDWLFDWPGFSEADKEAVRAQLADRAAMHVAATGLNGFPDFPTGPATPKSIYDNQSTENNLANALAGLVLWEAGDPYGTNAGALRLLDAAAYRFREMYAATRAHAPDGGGWEGQGYYGARLQGEVFFALAWLVATGEDLLAGNDHLRNAVYYWIYGLRPDGAASREGDHTCLPAGCARNRHIASILAAYYGNGHFQWYAERRGALAGGGWEEIAFYDPAVAALDPGTLPLHRHFQIGRIVVRTGWDIGPGSDDTYFTFDIHDWVSGHTHLDSGSFTLFRRGPLAIDSGRYRGDSAVDFAHERNYALRSVAHNTVTVYRAGEDFGGFANDGGQEFLFKESKAAEPRFVADLAAGTRFDTGTLDAFEVGPAHYYIKGNATDAYHSTGYQAPTDGSEAKLSHFTREIALFPGEPDPIAVVLDRVTALGSSWPKRWLLHSVEEPAVNGGVSSEQVPGHIATHEGDLVTISRAGGRLFGRTLLPSPARIRKVGGPGFEFWVDDPGANYPLSAPDVEAGAWRVEVQPTTASTADTFLHVLAVSTDAVAEMPPTRLIDAGAAHGAEVGDRVVLFGKTSAPVQDVEYDVQSGAAVRHLLTSMVPGQYDVTRDGVAVAGSPLATSPDRTLAFEAPGAGRIAVRWRSGVADLAVTALGNPPAGLDGGVSFTVSDTVANRGSASAEDSVTRYYLSVDTRRGPGDLPITGARPVPGLAAGAASTGSVTLAIPASTPHGLYFLIACADGAGDLAEGNEENNCRASAGTAQVGVPDLAAIAVSSPPASIRAGQGFSASVTVANLGTIVAPGSTARYYLSPDSVRDASDVQLSGSRSVPSLVPGGQAGGSTSVTVPTSTSPGLYLLLACADAGGAVVESDELNNCLASTSAVEVRVPDLVVTAAGAAAPGVAPGAALGVSDTTLNQGPVDAPSSRTRYYLSQDEAKSPDDMLLSGSRSVPSLAPGVASSGAASVTVPKATPLGTYRLLACADDLHAVGEQDEGNNCLAADAAVLVGRPDLIVTAVTSPATAQAGGALGVTDTVRNQGSVGAGASSTRYYVSEDRARSADDLRLTGARSVAPLGPGGASSGTASLTVPLAAPAGPRYVLACADDLAAVTESSETNNCAATDAPITLGAPDLVVAAVSGPPASIKRGAKFLVTDTTRNQGNAATMRNTRTRYYLSANQVWSADDRLLTGYRVVPALAAGTESTGSVNLTVPSKIIPGDYHVVVCADDLEVAPESNESNNCTATTARVTVTL